MNNMLKRLWRHLITTTRDGRKTFPPSALQAIQAVIAKGETLHRAEVRLVIEPSLSLADVFDKTTARERARELFAEYRIWDTEENCGILIYVNLADHQVEIVSDRAVGRALNPQDWQAVCHTMTAGFARGDYQGSVTTALEHLNRILHERFPDRGGANELSNQPIVL